MWLSREFDFVAGSLLGFTMFDYPALAKDTVQFSFPPTSRVYGVWPYILEDQRRCYYTYTKYYWWTKEWTITTRICDDSCGKEKTLWRCEAYSMRELEEQRWGCPGYLCASTSTFLIAQMDRGILNVTSPINSGKNISLIFNLTLGFWYRRVEDPELSDYYLRLLTINTIRIYLPKLRGYVSIPYTHELKGITVRLVPSGRYEVSVSSPDYKWKAPAYLDLTFGGMTTLTTTYTPVGYVAIAPGSGVESAKSFAFETNEEPYIDVQLVTDTSGMPVALLSVLEGYGLVVITLYVYITPWVDVTTSTVIPE